MYPENRGSHVWSASRGILSVGTPHSVAECVLRGGIEPFWGVSSQLKVGLSVFSTRRVIVGEGWLTVGLLAVVMACIHSRCLGKLGLMVGCWIDDVGRYNWLAAVGTG